MYTEKKNTLQYIQENPVSIEIGKELVRPTICDKTETKGKISSLLVRNGTPLSDSYPTICKNQLNFFIANTKIS